MVTSLYHTVAKVLLLLALHF